MCTLIALHRVWRDAPLVVATTRDEAYDRPAEGPAWREGDPPFIAPLDLEAGGTWMGANAAGVWVGVTNRHGGDVDPERRSRGLVCRDALARRSAGQVVETVGSMKRPTNPFHLVAGDGASLWLVEYEDGVVATRGLGSGAHVVTNRPFEESEGEPKVGRAWKLLEDASVWPVETGLDEPAGLVEALAGVLADHGVAGRDAICLHGGVYGTRSAAVWRIRPPTRADGEPPFDLAYAEGPPCSAPFEAFSGRVAE